MAASRQNFVRTALIFTLSAITSVSFGQPYGVMPELPVPSETREFTISQNDSTVYTLKLALDSGDMPLYYYSNLFTPVCFTGECKPVYINLYWDLLGHYIGYDVPPAEPLTKVDHLEFADEDYRHLHRILDNPLSLLKDFSIYDLVDTKTYNLSDSVDAVTGATPKTIKNEVISGAVYTCFTLWHIVHGEVVGEIERITEAQCNDDLIDMFLASDNHYYQYWAIDKVIDNQGRLNEDFAGAVMNIIAGKNIYTARYALEKIPPQFLSASDTLQTWLLSLYQKSHYSLQLNILEKFETVDLSDAAARIIAGELDRSNEAQFKRILALLEKQKTLPDPVILSLSRQLDNPNPVCAGEAFNTLTRLEVRDGSVKKRMKQFKKSKRNR